MDLLNQPCDCCKMVRFLSMSFMWSFAVNITLMLYSQATSAAASMLLINSNFQHQDSWAVVPICGRERMIPRMDSSRLFYQVPVEVIPWRANHYPRVLLFMWNQSHCRDVPPIMIQVWPLTVVKHLNWATATKSKHPRHHVPWLVQVTCHRSVLLVSSSNQMHLLTASHPFMITRRHLTTHISIELHSTL